MRVAVARLAGHDIPLDRVWSYFRLHGLHTRGLEAYGRALALRALARGAGVEVDEEEVAARLNAFRRERGLLQAAQVLELLEDLGLSQDDWERDAETALLAEALAERIPEAAVRERFFAQRARYEAIKLYEIELADAEVGQEILAQVKEGESFQELAREHSLDPGGRDTGGFLGWVRQGELGELGLSVSEFQAAPGTVIGPREGRLWLVAERREGLSEEVAAQVRDELLEEQVMSYLAAKGWEIL